MYQAINIKLCLYYYFLIIVQIQLLAIVTLSLSKCFVYNRNKIVQHFTRYNNQINLVRNFN